MADISPIIINVDISHFETILQVFDIPIQMSPISWLQRGHVSHPVLFKICFRQFFFFLKRVQK